MQVQFDGEITDVPALKAALEAKGIKVINIETSRWIGRDANGIPFDRGGRIDVELSDDHVLPEKRHVIDSLQQEIEKSQYVVKKTKPGK